MTDGDGQERTRRWLERFRADPLFADIDVPEAPGPPYVCDSIDELRELRAALDGRL